MSQAHRRVQTLAPGLATLLDQPQYVARETNLSNQLVARHYRLIIFSFAFGIFVLSLMRFYEQPVGRWLLGGALILYPLYTLFRNWLRGVMDENFYDPRVQLVRAQMGIAAITCLIGALAALNVQHHELWLLYTMPLWLVSEHNSTRTAGLVWLESVILLVAATLLGAQLSAVQTGAPWPVAATALGLAVQVLWLGLLTFLTHYLMRNIHGRDRAYHRHLEWLNRIAQTVVPMEQAQDQRRALLRMVSDVTGFASALWLPAPDGDTFVGGAGEIADAQVQAAAATMRVSVYFAHPRSVRTIRGCAISRQRSMRADFARIFVPVASAPIENSVAGTTRRQESDMPSYQLAGIIELYAPDALADDAWLGHNQVRLQDLAHYARPVLIASASRERQMRHEHLAARLNQISDPMSVTRQIVDDMKAELGFSFVTLAVVDKESRMVRFAPQGHLAEAEETGLPLPAVGWNGPFVCPAGCNLTSAAPNVLHNDEMDFLRSLDQRLPHSLKKSMWRVWLPIPNPPGAEEDAPPLAFVCAGTIREENRAITDAQIESLTHYCRNAGIAMANARLHHRQNRLASALTALHGFSRTTQPKALLGDLEAVARVVGREAERLFEAPAVVVHVLDGPSGRKREVYATPSADGRTQRAAAKALQLVEARIDDIVRAGASAYWPEFKPERFVFPNGSPDAFERWAGPALRARAILRTVKSLAFIPILSQDGKRLGGVFLAFVARHSFPTDERQVMEIFGGQASALIESSINYRDDREKAIAIERANLAGKLHDDLSQSLWALDLFARTAAVHLQKEQTDDAMAYMARVQQVAAATRGELQIALAELRSQPQQKSDFVADMQSHIASMSARFSTGVDFRVETQDSASCPSQTVQFYLTRIAREALNNALRHAPGCRICVHYAVEKNGEVHLSIEDEGAGFEVGQGGLGEGHGMMSMRHYADRIGGRVSVHSTIGHGTRIEVLVPAVERGE